MPNILLVKVITSPPPATCNLYIIYHLASKELLLCIVVQISHWSHWWEKTHGSVVIWNRAQLTVYQSSALLLSTTTLPTRYSIFFVFHNILFLKIVVGRYVRCKGSTPTIRYHWKANFLFSSVFFLLKIKNPLSSFKLKSNKNVSSLWWWIDIIKFSTPILNFIIYIKHYFGTVYKN